MLAVTKSKQFLLILRTLTMSTIPVDTVLLGELGAEWCNGDNIPLQ